MKDRHERSVWPKAISPALRLLAAMAAASAIAACGPSARLRTPDGFAVLEDQKEYLYRSTSAEGVVLAIRVEANKPRGNLEFWADALDRQLRRNGYAADGKTLDVRAASGQPGREMRYTREEGGRTYRFWLAVFVTEDRVWMIEAGGDEARLKGRTADAIQRAIESLTIG